MDFDAILRLECTHVLESASSKKRLIETLSDSIAKSQPGLDARALFDDLMAREKLGSTGLGEGVAIPHCRLAGRREPVAAFAKLTQPLPFDAPDGIPVDLVFVLAVPADAAKAHLQLLARLAAVFGDERKRARLRECPSASALHACLLELLAQT